MPLNFGGGGDNTIRYSRISWEGQQVFWGGGFTHGRWDIYGNRFFGGATSGKGLHAHSTNPTIGSIFVYNNVFANLNSSLTLKSNTTGTIKNNIFFDTADPNFGSTTHDFNWFETGMGDPSETNDQFGSDPFVDEPNDDYHLAAATDVGDPDIGDTYNSDPDGLIRGSDGIWDRGAFEFGLRRRGGGRHNRMNKFKRLGRL